MTTLASDSFNRTVTGGWGSADTGGVYALSNSTYYSCDGSNGIVSDPPGTTTYARLASVNSSATDVLASVGFNALPNSAGNVHSYIHARSISDSPSASTAYGVDLYVDGTGLVQMARRTNNVASEAVTIMTGFTLSQRLACRIQVFGLSPTTIRARAWIVGTTEPTSWNISVTDSTANLQTTGAVALGNFMTSSSSNTIAIRWDSLQVNDVVVAASTKPITVSATSAQRYSISALSTPANGGTVSYNISPSTDTTQTTTGNFSVPVPASGATVVYTITATEAFTTGSTSATTTVSVSGPASGTGTTGPRLNTLVRKNGAWI